MVSFKASSTLIRVEVLKRARQELLHSTLSRTYCRKDAKDSVVILSLYRTRRIGASEKRSEREMFEIVI